MHMRTLMICIGCTWPQGRVRIETPFTIHHTTLLFSCTWPQGRVRIETYRVGDLWKFRQSGCTWPQGRVRIETDTWRRLISVQNSLHLAAGPGED